MVKFPNFLARFRPVGTPGAAATGVPADRTTELAAELESSLSQLTQAQEQAAAIRAAASREAAAIRQEAGAEAARIVAEARGRAAHVRQGAAAPLLLAAREEAARSLAVGEQTAAQLRRRAAERMPVVVDHLVAEAFRGLGDPGPDDTGRPRWAPGGSGR
ncbi:hypothetical protein OHT93_03430 [Streptomyces sp. NBC_00191]|uniref:hypothetical protein n=1 Tax=Streptomyces sp. NBC_00191 TaxID=2975674 RepID=UPI0032533DAD